MKTLKLLLIYFLPVLIPLAIVATVRLVLYTSGLDWGQDVAKPTALIACFMGIPIGMSVILFSTEVV